MMRLPACAAALVAGASVSTAHAGVQEYFNGDREQWFDDASTAGAITTIGFNELPANTFVTDQYAHLGVLFTAINVTRGENFEVFPRDGFGLDGNKMIHLVFDAPQRGLAFDLPGTARADLYRNGQLVHESSNFGQSGFGNFGGIFDISFDEAIIAGPLGGINQVALDDLHFVSIPAPAVPVGLLLGALALRSRRRTPR